MRESEFRAWDTPDLGETFRMIYSCDYECLRDFFSIVGDSILMEYIGLKDKDGVDIFEGDIIDIHQTVNGCNIFIIEWGGLGWTVRYGMNMNVPRAYEYSIEDFFKPCMYSGEVDYEVIGNIYENPELLEISNERT